jgi:nitrite reductase/ring-hydroxylating ferredoxin subunit
LTADGALSDYIVECSWHFGSFDVRTGEGVAAPCRRPLRTYRVVLSDGGIWLALTPTQALEAGL